MDARTAAVEIVDSIHGYTCEFAPHPTVHEQFYDMAEQLIVKAINVALAKKENKG